MFGTKKLILELKNSLQSDLGVIRSQLKKLRRAERQNSKQIRELAKVLRSLLTSESAYPPDVSDPRIEKLKRLQQAMNASVGQVVVAEDVASGESAQD